MNLIFPNTNNTINATRIFSPAIITFVNGTNTLKKKYVYFNYKNLNNFKQKITEQNVDHLKCSTEVIFLHELPVQKCPLC